MAAPAKPRTGCRVLVEIASQRRSCDVDQATGKFLVGVLRVLRKGQPKLLHVRQALGAAGVFWKTGNKIAARMAMIAITTSSSMSVKPLRLRKDKDIFFSFVRFKPIKTSTEKSA